MRWTDLWKRGEYISGKRPIPATLVWINLSKVVAIARIRCGIVKLRTQLTAEEMIDFAITPTDVSRLSGGPGGSVVPLPEYLSPKKCTLLRVERMKVFCKRTGVGGISPKYPLRAPYGGMNYTEKVFPPAVKKWVEWQWDNANVKMDFHISAVRAYPHSFNSISS